ncbi:hypothetical protein NDU88_007804 [Pleurodeles waltl]|uniref:Uncharacterized protein n=1 Tax=Pleurodeles waltl TaxID=8319 RepID=A0AAV7N333_PLEWA|nr:hypothetical protein NDU88_007804 [Pleurodeles waltl]
MQIGYSVRCVSGASPDGRPGNRGHGCGRYTRSLRPRVAVGGPAPGDGLTGNRGHGCGPYTRSLRPRVAVGGPAPGDGFTPSLEAMLQEIRPC